MTDAAASLQGCAKVHGRLYGGRSCAAARQGRESQPGMGCGGGGRPAGRRRAAGQRPPREPAPPSQRAGRRRVVRWRAPLPGGGARRGGVAGARRWEPRAFGRPCLMAPERGSAPLEPPCPGAVAALGAPGGGAWACGRRGLGGRGFDAQVLGARPSPCLRGAGRLGPGAAHLRAAKTAELAPAHWPLCVQHQGRAGRAASRSAFAGAASRTRRTFRFMRPKGPWRGRGVCVPAASLPLILNIGISQSAYGACRARVCSLRGDARGLIISHL